MDNLNNKRVLVYGDANIDLFVMGVRKIPAPGTEQFIGDMPVCVGGGAALTALGLGKLGINTLFGGVLADDELGSIVMQRFAAVGVDTGAVKISTTKKTGISISFTNEYDRSFITDSGTNSQLDACDILDIKEDFSHLHLTGYSGRDRHETYMKVLKTLKERGDVTISMDVGYDGKGEWFEGIYELLPYVDVFFANEKEICGYGRCQTPREAAVRMSRYAKLVAVKLGNAGSMAVQNGEIIATAQPFKVQAVDTTGAGDSFNAGFLCGYLSGETIEKSLMMGNACGAGSVTGIGGNTAFPNRDEVMKMIAEYKN